MRIRTRHILAMIMGSLGLAGCAPEVPPPIETIQSASQALDTSSAWKNVAHMVAKRDKHAAITLVDLRVLVVGGTDEITETAEVYNPEKNEWTLLDVPASSATSATCAPGLAQLDNGIVVMVSTFPDIGKMGTVSTFDPVTGVWTTLSTALPIRTCRANVIPLDNGRALIFADDADSDQVVPFYFDSGKFDPMTNLPIPKVGTWKNAAIIRLLDNRVLMSGGAGTNQNERNGESVLYDPASPNVWAPVGELFFARSHHSVALLPNGNVLAAGGLAIGPFDNDWNDTTEIFDVSSMTWAPAAPMLNPRTGQTATSLSTGFVMLLGGSTSSTAELFDPSTNAWLPLENGDVRFFDHSTTLLQGSVVLVTGGSLQSATDSAIVCDALAFAWEPRTSLPANDRGFHSATIIDDSQLFVVGGIASNGDLSAPTALQDAWMYNSKLDTWTAKDNPTSQYAFHTATKLLDDRVLVAGGIAGNSAEIFDPSAETNPWQTTESMPTAIMRATATTLKDGRVLHVGGLYSTGTASTASEIFIYDPTTKTWSSGPDLLQPETSRFGHTATLLDDDDGSVLVAGGCEMTAGNGVVSAPFAGAAVFNPKSNTWTSVGSMKHARAFHSATRLDDGRVLVTGGGELAYFSQTQTKSTWTSIYSTAEIYNPTTKTWTLTGSLNEARTQAESVLLGNGRVLISGGRKTGAGRTLSSAEIFDPIDGSFTATSRMQVPRYGHSLTLLNGGVIAVGGIHPFPLKEGVIERFPQAEQGDPCTLDDQCKSKYCVDGVCCKETCNSPCLACSKAASEKKKLEDGICEDVSGCSPYACQTETGTCGTTCTEVDDCATGYVCEPLHTCIEPRKNASTIDDTGCAAARIDSNASSWASLAFIAGVYVVRRRKHQRKS